ncbi:MAG: hypothetical protein JWR26_1251 [Pedosphaera sp.]|nr:hypothetical protein [Pedosphaera sp.]
MDGSLFVGMHPCLQTGVSTRGTMARRRSEAPSAGLCRGKRSFSKAEAAVRIGGWVFGGRWARSRCCARVFADGQQGRAPLQGEAGAGAFAPVSQTATLVALRCKGCWRTAIMGRMGGRDLKTSRHVPPRPATFRGYFIFFMVAHDRCGRVATTHLNDMNPDRQDYRMARIGNGFKGPEFEALPVLGMASPGTYWTHGTQGGLGLGGGWRGWLV